MKKLLAVLPILLLAASVSHAQSSTGTSTLSVTVGAEAAIVVNATPAFASSGIFGNYTATTPFTYYVRTITGGSVVVEITTNFSTGGVGGGPSVANPPHGWRPAHLHLHRCVSGHGVGNGMQFGSDCLYERYHRCGDLWANHSIRQDR